MNPIELSFPCPACGTRLTVQQTVASGPCPHCQTAINVELKASVQGIEVEAPTRLPKPGEKVVFLKNSFDRRRFRPASQAIKTKNNARQHPSQF